MLFPNCRLQRRELAHDPLRDPVVANDICHVYFVNDAEMHALHNLLARVIEEQASRGAMKRANCWQSLQFGVD
jgi:hypothetical protein